MAFYIVRITATRLNGKSLPVPQTFDIFVGLCEDVDFFRGFCMRSLQNAEVIARLTSVLDSVSYVHGIPDDF